MKYLVLLIVLTTILHTYRLSIIYLRKDVTLLKKIFETLVLITLIILSFFNLNYENHITIYISLIIMIYVVIMFIIDVKNKNNYVSILSVKNSLDMASCGILFLKDKNKIILINNTMNNIILDLCQVFRHNFSNNLIYRI